MVTTAVTEQLGEHLLRFHGDAVALGGVGVLLPAGPGNGKTTFVAAGFTYLSDEVAVLGPTTRAVLPFPRSLCVESGSVPVLVPLFPRIAGAPRYRRLGEADVTYLVTPADSWPDGPVPARRVVFPRDVAGEPTTLAPLPRRLATRRLLEQTLRLEGTEQVRICDRSEPEGYGQARGRRGQRCR